MCVYTCCGCSVMEKRSRKAERKLDRDDAVMFVEEFERDWVYVTDLLFSMFFTVRIDILRILSYFTVRIFRHSEDRC